MSQHKFFETPFVKKTEEMNGYKNALIVPIEEWHGMYPTAIEIIPGMIAIPFRATFHPNIDRGFKHGFVARIHKSVFENSPPARRPT